MTRTTGFQWHLCPHDVLIIPAIFLNDHVDAELLLRSSRCQEMESQAGRQHEANLGRTEPSDVSLFTKIYKSYADACC
jgi:hypothetical protein